MPSLLPTSTLLQVADICQYLAAGDISKGNALNSGVVAPSLALQIFNAKTVVRWIYNLNPNDSSLSQTGTYLYQLLGSYAIKAQQILNSALAGPPVLTGPTNQTVTEGSNATFTVSVVGAGPFTFEWYDNLGNLITGATTSNYIFPNAQIIDTDKYFYVKVTDVNGRQTVSNIAFLTVTEVLQGFYYYGDTDYTADLQGGNDDVPYLGPFPITNGNPLSITLPIGAANNKWEIFKYPVSQGIKTTWFNTALNQGTLPDGVFQSVLTIGSFYYIYSRVQISIDTSQPMVFS